MFIGCSTQNILVCCPVLLLQALQFGDVQWRDKAVGVLLSYNPFWLRLGMEVVTHMSVTTTIGMCADCCSCVAA